MPIQITTAYGDISPRTAAFVVKDLLDRAMPYLVFEKFGQSKPQDKNTTLTMKFRRYFLKTTFAAGYYPAVTPAGGTFNPAGADKYNPKDYTNSAHFNPATHQLAEGVTPDGSLLASEDMTTSLVQYGDKVTITDVVQDTHEDNVLREAITILGEQAALMLEKVRFNRLCTGTNVFYAGATDALVATRGTVAGPLTLALQRKIVRALKRNLARPITSTVRSTPSFGTQAIAPAYIAIAHTDLEIAIRGLTGFISAENYGTMTPFETEIGKVEDVRYLTSTVVSPFIDSGVAVGATGMFATGTKIDVYPILFLARDAYGITPLKGGSSITPMVVNPKPSDSDPLAQRGHVAWKAWHGAVILNQAWMARAEVGCLIG